MTTTKAQVQAKLTAIANNIRIVNGTQAQMSLDGMATAVAALHDDTYVTNQVNTAVSDAYEELITGSY